MGAKDWPLPVLVITTPIAVITRTDSGHSGTGRYAFSDDSYVGKRMTATRSCDDSYGSKRVERKPAFVGGGGATSHAGFHVQKDVLAASL